MEKYVKINDVIDQLANEFGCVDAVTRGMLYALPDADVEPVRHGRWVAETERTGNYAHCSMCGCRCRGYVPHYKYCPDCGAKMDGGAGE